MEWVLFSIFINDLKEGVNSLLMKFINGNIWGGIVNIDKDG